MKEYYVIKNFLDGTTCDNILNQLNKLNFNKAKQQNNGRYNKELFIFDNEICRIIEDKISNFSFGKNKIFKFSKPFEFYKYEKYDFIKPHCDAAEDFGNSLKSNFTAIIYLNDDFDGGETNLISLDIKVTAKKGKLLLFSQDLLHEACIIHSGSKYIYRSNWLIKKK